MVRFLEGYRREFQVDSEWLKHIPQFLKRPEFDLYIIIHRSFDLDDLGAWERSFMHNRKSKPENDVPYVDIDFGSL